MAIVEIRMTADQMEGAKAAVATWLKQPGDSIQIYEPILEIATDKAILEIPAPATGILKKKSKSCGDFVHSGDLLGEIETEI